MIFRIADYVSISHMSAYSPFFSVPIYIFSVNSNDCMRVTSNLLICSPPYFATEHIFSLSDERYRFRCTSLSSHFNFVWLFSLHSSMKFHCFVESRCLFVLFCFVFGCFSSFFCMMKNKSNKFTCERSNHYYCLGV